MHLVPVPINVRCYSNSNPIVRRSEVTLRAKTGSSFYHSISRACVISVLFSRTFILN